MHIEPTKHRIFDLYLECLNPSLWPFWGHQPAEENTILEQEHISLLQAIAMLVHQTMQSWTWKAAHIRRRSAE